MRILAFILLLAGSAAMADDLEVRAQDMEQRLMCPTCQGQSLFDSDSDMAQAMRLYIREELATGRAEDEIIQELVTHYGEGILLSPPLRGLGWFLWLMPVLFLLIGGLLFRAGLRREKPEL